jgi:glycosyltransferase involved in cell wall biosynthesis
MARKATEDCESRFAKSNDPRRSIAKANFVGTVHHGIPTNLHTPIFNPRGGYVAFLGRISPEKRPDRAIRIARTLGIPLKIAAKVDKVDEAFPRKDCAAVERSGSRVHRRDQ